MHVARKRVTRGVTGRVSKRTGNLVSGGGGVCPGGGDGGPLLALAEDAAATRTSRDCCNVGEKRWDVFLMMCRLLIGKIRLDGVDWSVLKPPRWLNTLGPCCRLDIVIELPDEDQSCLYSELAPIHRLAPSKCAK